MTGSARSARHGRKATNEKSFHDWRTSFSPISGTNRFPPWKLGAGPVIFKGRKTGDAGGTEVSHAYPILSFRKPSWSVSNRPFPVLTVLPVWMTGVSSAALSTPSSTDFSGRMHLMSTAPTKRCTTALSGGAGSVFSIKFSLSWQIKHLLMAP